MGRRRKRTNNGSVVVLLILFMVFGANIRSLHVCAETWGDYKYEVIDEWINIEAYIGNDTVLVIPSTIAGKKVRRIGEDAFRNCNELTDVTIPSSVTYIDDCAFYGCSGLMSISVAENNANYCSEAGVLFNKDKSELLCCPAGKKGRYTIPSSVTYIDGGAFGDCSSLTNVTIPSSVTYIGSAFWGCSSLIGISVIENNANYCSEAGVLFNKDKSELVCCPAGKEGRYIIPSSVVSIGSEAFADCSNLTNVTIPSSVTDIGEGAFIDCSGLTDLAIPFSVTSIGYKAFMGCSGLTSLTIPGSVTNIDLGVFFECSRLTDIIVAENNPSYCSEKGVLFNKDKSMLICYPAGKKGKYIVPESVTCIYIGAFHGCSELTNLTIPRSVTDIVLGGSSDCGFEGCYNITLLVEHGSYAENFAKVHNIPYQYIGSTIESPEEPKTEQSTTIQPTIERPTGEEEKVVVDNVTIVPVETETDEKSIIDNKIKNKSGSNTVEKGTVLVGRVGIYKVTNVKKKMVIYMKPKNKRASSVKIPADIKIKKKKYKVTSVSANAFRNNKKIKTVTIGQNVKVIGKNAFRGCKNLKKVSIGRNVTTIGSYAFYGNKKLNLIEFRSNKLKKVGKAAFKKIAKHPTIRVPKGKMDSYKKLFKGKI